MVGHQIGRYNRTLNAVRAAIAGKRRRPQHQVTSAAEAAVLQQPHEINLRLDNVITAVEAALLDLLGQHLGVPVCELLGAGQQRDRVPHAGLPVLHRRPRPHRPAVLPAHGHATTTGMRLRHEAALTPARSSRRPRPPSSATASATSSSRAA